MNDQYGGNYINFPKLVDTRKTKKKTTRRKSEMAAAKKAIKEKLKNMTKEEKENYRKGKRDPDSDSDYSYRSVVSAGGTRHVMRRRKREDGTYSDEESYHSDQVRSHSPVMLI